MWFQLSILAFLYFHFGKPGVKQTTVDLSRAVHTLLFFLCFIFWRQFYVLWLQSLFQEPSPFIHSTSNCYSVAQSSLTLCDPMDYGTPGFPVHHLPEFAQTHVSEAIQPSYPVIPFSSCFSLSQHQGLFQSARHIRWPKYWSFNNK